MVLPYIVLALLAWNTVLQELASGSKYTVTLWCKLFHYAISQSHGDSLTHYVIHFSTQPNVKSTADTLGTDTLNLHFCCTGWASVHCELSMWSDVSLFTDICSRRQRLFLLRNAWLLSHLLWLLYNHINLIMIKSSISELCLILTNLIYCSIARYRG